MSERKHHVEWIRSSARSQEIKTERTRLGVQPGALLLTMTRYLSLQKAALMVPEDDPMRLVREAAEHMSRLDCRQDVQLLASLFTASW